MTTAPAWSQLPRIVQAALKKGYKKAQCRVEEGDYKKALEIAIQENCRGPLSLSRQEKLNTIEKTLKYFPERANSWIGEMIGVSMQTVEKVRKQLESSEVIKTYDKLETRDGRSYPRAMMDKVGANLDKTDDSRDNSPSREDIIASLSTPRRNRPEQSGLPAPDVFTGDYARQGQIGPRKEGFSSEQLDSLFVEDIDLNGEVLSVSVSVDANKAIRIIKRDENIIVAIYYIKGDRFFNDSHIVLDRDTFSTLFSRFPQSSE